MEIRNRIVMSPMQQYNSPEGIVGQWHLVHLGSRAVGGAGIVYSEATAVSPEARSTYDDAGIWNNDQMESWKSIVSFLQEQGSKAVMQLSHFGSKGSRSHPTKGWKYQSPGDGGWQTVSSSAVAPFRGMAPPVALDHEGIEKVKSDFVNGARRAVKAGFDAVEIHAAHGYLFHQFYSLMVNQRDDEYGGSFENRIRLLIETVQAVRKEIPQQMPLFVRISAVDYLDDEKAWQLEDSVKLTKVLKENGVDVVTASAGGFVFLDKSKVHPSYQVPFADSIKKETGILTGTVGMITDYEQANEIIASDKADLVVIAREYLRNPYFAINAAKALEIETDIPWQYKRAYM